MYTHARNAAATRLPYSSPRLHRHGATALYAAYVRTYDVRRSGRICRCSRGRGIREAPVPPIRPFRHLRLPLRPTLRRLSSCRRRRVLQGNGQTKLIQVHSNSLIYCNTHFFYISRYRLFPREIFRNTDSSRQQTFLCQILFVTGNVFLVLKDVNITLFLTSEMYHLISYIRFLYSV